MRKIRMILMVLLGAFSMMVGVGSVPAFAADKVTTTHAKSAKVDVNNATEEELMELPGIGEAYAKKIVAGRPYKTEADIVKAGVPQKTVDNIKHAIKFGKVKEVHKAEPKAATKTDKTDVKTSSKATEKSSTKVSNDTTTPQVPPKKGMVWVNTESNVYHKEGDRWYGNTKNGKFMNEADAIKAGARISKED